MSRSSHDSTGGYVDDAIHIVNPDERSSTLCAQDCAGRNTVEPTDPLPDWGAGCWTCIEEARHV